MNMRDYLAKSLNRIRRGVLTFCAAIAMIVVYGVSTIVTQGLAIAGITTAALVSTASKASAHRRRYRHSHRRRRRRRRGRSRRRRGRRWRGRRRRGRGRRRYRRGRPGITIRF